MLFGRRGERSMDTPAPQREDLLLGMDADLTENGAEMVPHRALAQIHLGSDGRHTLSSDQTGHDLPLAGRQLGPEREPEGVGCVDRYARLDLGSDDPEVLGEFADLALRAGRFELILGC